MVWTQLLQYILGWNLIAWVKRVLRKTVHPSPIQLPLTILTTNHSDYSNNNIGLNFQLSLDSDDDFRSCSGCWNVSHHQPSFSGLISPWRSYSNQVSLELMSSPCRANIQTTMTCFKGKWHAIWVELQCAKKCFQMEMEIKTKA